MVNWNINFCNTTLDRETTDDETKSFGSLTFHQLGLIICAGTGLFATLLSFYLMFMHATHYSRPWEQRHILRILFMIPVYSVVSFLGYYFYHHFVYYQVIRDCYDAFAIASFFSLLCHYTAPDLHGQKDYFRMLTPKNWLLPVTWFQKCCGSQRQGPWRIPRSGLTWFNVVWVFIFQYCLLRLILTIVAVITQYYGRYCVEGLSPAYFHVWNNIISALSVTLAMYCLIQFYYQLKQDIAEHSPLIKVLSIKLVIFFVFWQTIILGFLNSTGVISASEKIAQPDITIGIPSMLIDIEMALFAIMHVFAYPWKEYDVNRANLNEAGTSNPMNESSYQGGKLGIKAYLDAFNPWDMIKAIGRGFKWLFVGHRKREEDSSYKQDVAAVPLQNIHPTKGGRYEQIDDTTADDEHEMYEPYDRHATDRIPLKGDHSDQGTAIPVRHYEEDGLIHVLQQPQSAGTTHVGFNQDTGYHAPTSAQTAYMPEESQYYNPRTR